jgi:hypothetical protein
VRQGWSEQTPAALRALTDEVIAGGVERGVAERAVTRWIITRRSIWECVRAEVAGEP